MNTRTSSFDTRDRSQHGFSMLELTVVIAIILVVAAAAVPYAINAAHNFRLINAGSQFSGLVQQARSRAVRDSTYYSVDLSHTTPITLAWVDINKDETADPTDPTVSWSPEVVPQAHTSAPSYGTLQALFLPTTSGLAPVDAYNTSSAAITFSPMGTPCTVTSQSGGSVCNSTGGATAYWIFFQNTANGAWLAVTVTPAGKIQKWKNDGGWAAL